MVDVALNWHMYQIPSREDRLDSIVNECVHVIRSRILRIDEGEWNMNRMCLVRGLFYLFWGTRLTDSHEPVCCMYSSHQHSPRGGG